MPLRARRRRTSATPVAIAAFAVVAALAVAPTLGVRQSGFANVAELVGQDVNVTSALALVGAQIVASHGGAWTAAAAEAAEMMRRQRAGQLDLDVSENPDLLLVAAHCVFFCICVSKVWISHSSAAQKSEEVRSHRDQVLHVYSGTVQEAEGILKGMLESSAHFVEWNFESKRRTFQKFLGGVAECPESFLGMELMQQGLDPLRVVVKEWLKVFEQCSMAPIEHPFIIVSDGELEACTSISEIATLVRQRLSDNEVTFIKAVMTDMKALSGADDLVHDIASAPSFTFGLFGWGMRTRVEDQVDLANAYPLDCLCGCIKLTLMSHTHLLFIMCFYLGIVIIALEVLLNNLLVGGFVSASVAMLAYCLYNIDEVDQTTRLTRELHSLKRAAEAVQEHHRELSAFTDRLRRLDHIWRLRTMPSLDLLMESLEHLSKTPKAERLRQLECMSDRLPALLEGLGPLSLWFAEIESSPELLETVAVQLQQCTEYIESQRCAANASSLVVARLGGPLGFLVVKILACHNLTNKVTRTSAAMGGVVQPLVAIRLLPLSVGAELRELTTQCDQKTVNPVWDEEFFLPLPWNAEGVELHVYDVSGVSLGFHIVSLRDLPAGVWCRGNQRLRSLKKATFKKSEIVFDMMYAQEFRQLYEVDIETPHTLGDGSPRGA